MLPYVRASRIRRFVHRTVFGPIPSTPCVYHVTRTTPDGADVHWDVVQTMFKIFIPHVHSAGSNEYSGGFRMGSRGNLTFFKFKKQLEICSVFCGKDTYVCIVRFNSLFFAQKFKSTANKRTNNIKKKYIYKSFQNINELRMTLREVK